MSTTWRRQAGGVPAGGYGVGRDEETMTIAESGSGSGVGSGLVTVTTAIGGESGSFIIL